MHHPWRGLLHGLHAMRWIFSITPRIDSILEVGMEALSRFQIARASLVTNAYSRYPIQYYILCEASISPNDIITGDAVTRSVAVCVAYELALDDKSQTPVSWTLKF